MKKGECKISGRYFLVGAARSGTTLLQSMLASHPQVYSFPESHFFCEAVPRRRRDSLLRLSNRTMSRKPLENLLAALQRPDLSYLAPRHSPFLRSYVRAFRQMVDQAALDQGKDIWLEKTPHHVDYIGIISRMVPEARFIHIIRDGRDVVASQLYAIKEEKAPWGNWNADQLVDVWNRDVQTSLNYRSHLSHILVLYDALLESPEKELSRITEFMGLEFSPGMLRYWEAADTVVGWRGSYPWMKNVFGPLQDTRLKKFHQVFFPEDRQRIENSLLWGGQVKLLCEQPIDGTASKSLA